MQDKLEKLSSFESNIEMILKLRPIVESFRKKSDEFSQNKVFNENKEKFTEGSKNAIKLLEAFDSSIGILLALKERIKQNKFNEDNLYYLKDTIRRFEISNKKRKTEIGDAREQLEKLKSVNNLKIQSDMVAKTMVLNINAMPQVITNHLNKNAISNQQASIGLNSKLQNANVINVIQQFKKEINKNFINFKMFSEYMNKPDDYLRLMLARLAKYSRVDDMTADDKEDFIIIFNCINDPKKNEIYRKIKKEFGNKKLSNHRASLLSLSVDGANNTCEESSEDALNNSELLGSAAILTSTGGKRSLSSVLNEDDATFNQKKGYPKLPIKSENVEESDKIEHV